MLYELKIHERRYGIDQSIIVEYDGLLPREEVQHLACTAECEIQEFIEEGDDTNETMYDIAELYDDGFTLEAIIDYLCTYNGFSRWYPPERMRVYID